MSFLGVITSHPFERPQSSTNEIVLEVFDWKTRGALLWKQKQYDSKVHTTRRVEHLKKQKYFFLPLNIVTRVRFKL